MIGRSFAMPLEQMGTHLRNIASILTIMLASAVIGGTPVARGLLHADGIVDVKGASAAEAVVTVIPADAPAYSLEKGTTRFQLELELNNTYMIRFEHPDCITKQLYFDTKVPDEYRLDEYTFPFLVELEKDRFSGDMAYAGPVGYIAYMEMVNDFDYETDYTMRIDKRIEEKLASIELHTAPVMGTAGPIKATPVNASYSSVSSGASVSHGPSDPSITRVGARNDHAPALESAIPIEQEEAAAPIEPVTTMIEPEDIGTPEPLETEVPDAPPVAVESEKEPRTEPAPELLAEATPVRMEENAEIEKLDRRSDLEDPSLASRQEELIVDRKMVTTIVRIADEQGNVTEYRRVAHKFGQVFYFMDDQSIPEHMYREHTGM